MSVGATGIDLNGAEKMTLGGGPVAIVSGGSVAEADMGLSESGMRSRARDA